MCAHVAAMLAGMRYRFGVHELDTDTELLSGPEGSVSLRRQTYRLLKLLLERAPALVTRDELMDELWGHHALSPNVVPQTVSELRQALGDDPQQPRYIETRHRRGYAFIAAVTIVDESPDSVPAFPQPETVTVATPARTRSPWFILGLVAALVCLLIGLYWRATPGPAELAPVRIELNLAINDTELDLYLRQFYRAQAHTIVLPAGIQAAAWQLAVRDGQWRIADPGGRVRASGRVPATAIAAQAETLIAAVSEASGVAAIHPPGWPASTSERSALAAAIAARAGDRPGLAARAYAEAATAPGWTTLYEAEALADAGEWTLAAKTLQALQGHELQMLALQAEALRARLSGRPLEALSALRTLALLQPESIQAQLAVVDAQLDNAQWDAADDSLNALVARIGADWPALQLRRALWRAARQPGAADTAFRLAAEAAEQHGDAASARAARLAWANWQLERNLLEQVDVALAALPPDDTDAELVRGYLALERGELGQAIQRFDRSVAAYLERGRGGDARRARIGLVELALRQGDPASAATQAQALLDEAQLSGDQRVRLDAMDALGRAQTGLGRFDAARTELLRAIELAHDMGDLRREARARYHLGNCHAQERQRPAEAEQAYRLAAESFRQLRDDLWETKAQANLALMAERDGRRLDARAAYQVALERVRQLDMPREFGRIHLNAGINEREIGELGTAAELLDQALLALDQAGAADIAVFATSVRADLALLQGDVRRARNLLESSAEPAAAATDLPHSMWLSAQARMLQLAGDAAAADRNLAAAGALRSRAGVRTAELDAELQRLRLQLDNASAARDARLPFERIEAEFLRLGEHKYALSAGLAMVEAELASGSARAALQRAQRLRADVQSRGNRTQQLHLDWLLALAGPDSERGGRLQALARDAAVSGHGLLERLAQRALLPTDSVERRDADQLLRRDGLIGATVSPASAL